MTPDKSARENGKKQCRLLTCPRISAKGTKKGRSSPLNMKSSRVGHERKAASKIRQETDVRESPSLPPFSSLKHHSIKACSLRKAENALPNIPRKKVEIVISLIRNS